MNKIILSTIMLFAFSALEANAGDFSQSCEVNLKHDTTIALMLIADGKEDIKEAKASFRKRLEAETKYKVNSKSSLDLRVYFTLDQIIQSAWSPFKFNYNAVFENNDGEEGSNTSKTFIGRG